MTRIFRAPAHYIQGPGAIVLLGDRVARLGRVAAVVVDAAVLPAIEARLAASLGRQDLDPRILPFAGDVTHAAMDGLAGTVRDVRGEVVVGVGGGRTLDAAKGAARRTGLPFVSVPTAASTDAPATRGIVIYDAAHRLVAAEQMDDNPAYVIADTEIIAAAPARTLRGGIGDALTAKWEAEAVARGTGLSKQGTRPLASAVMLGDLCWRLLRTHGVGAMAAAGTGVPTPDLEAVVEAVLLLSAVAFENTGLSLAHAIATELGAIPAVAAASLHGEHAAYGTLVQAVYEGRPAAELDDLFAFAAAVGLPRTLADLGLPEDAAAAAVPVIAAAAAASPHAVNQAVPPTAETLSAAIRTVEARAAVLDAAVAAG